MEPPQKRQKLDPPPQNVPSQSTFRDTYGNELLSSFDGSGISNPGGNFHVAGNVHINSNASPQPPAANDNRQVLLESLRFDQIDARHDSIKRAHAKTCRWFPDTDVYKNWEAKDSSDVNNFLWIKGKPGAGKSTLMKFLHGQIHARTRRKNKNEILISFFFNARGHELEKSTFGLYRSLLWQLLDKKPDLQHVLDELRPGYQWTDERLKSLIEDAIQDLGDTPIFCLIDALDECDQDQIRDMVVFLEALVDVQSSLHVCFASRHYPHITVQRSHEIILEERDGHEKDIASYLSSALRITPKSLAEQIRSEMQAKAHGVFMWVVLVVDILNKEFDSGRKYKLQERLQQLPGDLHLLFRDILTRDTHNREGLLLCIQWVLFAKEPLTPTQLHLAILSGTEPEFLAHCHSEPYLEEDVQRYILDNSKGLAQSTKSKKPTVQFIHESVRDFLLKGNGLDELFSGLESNIRGKSHEALKNCCLTYVTMESLMELETYSSSKAIQEFPFLEYANSGLLYHGNEAAIHGISQDGFLAMFPLNQWVKQHNIMERFENRKYTTTVSLLYILAEAGMPHLIRAYSGRQSCFEIENERYGVPILAASALKHESTMQAMLELEAKQIPCFDFAEFCERFRAVAISSQRSSRAFEFRRKGGLIEQLIDYGDERISLFFLQTREFDSWSPGIDLSVLFFGACRYGRFESARKLAEVFASIPAGRNRETPLHDASTYGALAAAEVLVSRGADLNAKNWAGSTPLHCAAGLGRLEIAKLLIDCGADVSAANESGDTPLHEAAKKGHLQLAQLLLDHNASVLDFNLFHKTPLHSAAFLGHIQLVQLLLDYGVDIQATNGSGTTPLHEACRGGSLGTAQLLIDRGADILAKAEHGKTPLHCAFNEETGGLLLDHGADIYAMDESKAVPLHDACQNSRTKLARHLLERGANISATDTYGETPLHKACQGYWREATVGTIEMLIENKADPSAATNNGKTPLHQLLSDVQFGGYPYTRLVIAKILVNSGADILCRDKDGRTPLQLASSKDDWKSIVDFLQSRILDSSSSAAHLRIEGPLQFRSPSNQHQLQRDDLLKLG